MARGRFEPLGEGLADRGIASVVTGAGKTVFAEHCMAEAARHIANLHFIVLLPTNALLDQWYVSMREDLGLSPDEIANTLWR